MTPKEQAYADRFKGALLALGRWMQNDYDGPSSWDERMAFIEEHQDEMSPAQMWEILTRGNARR